MALLVVLLLAFRLVCPGTTSPLEGAVAIASLPPQHVESVGEAPSSVGTASMLRGASSKSSHCSDEEPERVKQLEQALRGYNIYRGSPLLGSGVGSDPGLGPPIFKEAYQKKKTTGDCSYWVPDGMELLFGGSCNFDFDSKEVSTSSEYSRRLNILAKVEGSVPVIGSFSASTDYDNFMKRSTADKETWVEYHAECVQFQTYVHQGKLPPFASDFHHALVKLDANLSDAAFFDFFDAWGTHFTYSAFFGARYGAFSYVSERGVSELKEQGVSLETAAKYSAIFELGGSLETKAKTTARETFDREQTSSRKIAVGARPPLGADNQAVDNWIRQTREKPVPMRYTLKSLCEVLEDRTKKEKCESAAPRYCLARVDSWREENPSARCNSLTPTTTTTTTPASTDCMGSPPRCCSGGYRGLAGQWSDDNFVHFEGLSSIGQDDIVVDWSMDTCSVSQDQPFGQGDYGPSSGPGLEVVAEKRNAIVVHAGRSNMKQNADAFCSGLDAANLLGIYQGRASKPKELNFAFAGTLTLTFQGKTLTFPDFRLGQGQRGRSNNWWIGSAACLNINGDGLRCKSREDVYIQFQGKWWKDNIFMVGYA